MRRSSLWLSICGGALLWVAPTAAQTAPQPQLARFDAAVAGTKQAMMSDPARALRSADAAFALARALPDSRQARLAIATALWLQAEAHIFLNEADKARPLVDAALATVATDAPTSKLAGDLLRSRGAIAAMGGKVQDALRDFQRAYRVFVAAHEPRSEAIALQDIGQIYWDANDYEKVLQYYAQSAETYDADPALTLTTHNNRAEVLRKLKRLPEAAKEYRAALVDAGKLGSPLLQVRILSNLAAVQVESGDIAGAQRTVARASAMAASGEAAGWRPFVRGVAAKVAFARGDVTGAAADLDAMFADVDLAKTEMSYKEFHQLAARVYEAAGRAELALQHLKAFQRLDGDARDLTASTSSQLMSARFDFANQNLKISRLKQGQLERDVQIERQRSRFRTVVLGGALAAGGVVFTLLLFGYVSIRRSRNQVRDANVTLTSVNERLEKALKAKTDFLATTSHEIRTPLNGILGMTQVLLSDERVDREVRERVQVVHGAGETMRALVDDILDVAKMETGEITLAHQPVDLKRVLTDVATLWRGHAEAKGLDLKLDIAGAPHAIVSDDLRLRQILFNLMSNAVKFTNAGSVELAARLEGAEQSPMLVLRVTDTGIGIPGDEQEQIFEPFHQVDGGVTRQFAGTGLGLAICKKLVGAFGGTISVTSEVAQGSTFTVTLPAELPAGAAAPAAVARPASLAEARLVIVDANPLAQGMMQAMLAPAASEVAAFDSADAMLAGAGLTAAHHVLLEPGAVQVESDVLDALRSVIERVHASGASVTLLASPMGLVPIDQLVLVGADQLVLKPISAGDLIVRLSEVFAGTPDASATAEAA